MTKSQIYDKKKQLKKITDKIAQIFFFHSIIHFIGNFSVLHLSLQFSLCFFVLFLFTTYLFKLNPFVTIKTWGIFFLGLSITESENRAEMLTYTIVLRNLLDRNFIHISLLPGINANISLTLQIKVFGTLYTNRTH